MSALPPPPPLLLLLTLLAAPSVLARRAEFPSASQPEANHQLPPDPGNGTRLGSGVAGGEGSNSSGNAVVTRISSLLRDLPTLKATVILACAFSALLIACLLLRVFRWVGSCRPVPGSVGSAGGVAMLLPPSAGHLPRHLRAQVLGLGAFLPEAYLSALCQGGIWRVGACIWFSRDTFQEPFPPLRLFGVVQIHTALLYTQ